MVITDAGLPEYFLQNTSVSSRIISAPRQRYMATPFPGCHHTDHACRKRATLATRGTRRSAAGTLTRSCDSADLGQSPQVRGILQRFDMETIIGAVFAVLVLLIVEGGFRSTVSSVNTFARSESPAGLNVGFTLGEVCSRWDFSWISRLIK